MKKFGFTLTELLLSMTILGVIGAVAVSSVNKILPDKDKAIVLKVYKTVSDINNEMFTNPSLYIMDSSCTKILLCTAAPMDGKHSNCTGTDKYPYLLGSHLILDNEGAISKTEGTENKYSFTTEDGIAWELTAKADGSYKIKIDTKRGDRSACFFDSDSCQKPRLFEFDLSNGGVLSGSDNLTKAYLQNPSNLNDRKNDLNKAATME